MNIIDGEWDYANMLMWPVYAFVLCVFASFVWNLITTWPNLAIGFDLSKFCIGGACP